MKVNACTEPETFATRSRSFWLWLEITLLCLGWLAFILWMLVWQWIVP